MTPPLHILIPRLGSRRATWLTVLCALMLSLLAPEARAAAPLCDPSGASMPAPVPVLPNATGDLVAPKGCDDLTHGAFDLGKTTRNDGPAVRTVDVPERVVATQLVWPKAAGTKLSRPDRSGTPDLPGHTLPVYRPPRG